MKHTGLFIFKPTSLLDEIARFWLIQILASKAEFKEYSSLYLWVSRKFARLAHHQKLSLNSSFLQTGLRMGFSLKLIDYTIGDLINVPVHTSGFNSIDA